MTSSSPTVATTSDSHSAPDDRVVVDHSTAGRSNIRLATIGAEAAADDLGDDVEAGVAAADRAVGPIDEGDDRVEVAAGDRPEDQDQPDQRAGRGGGVLEQLQPDIARRQPAGHDPGPDHGDDQQAGAERLGDQAPRQLDRDLAGAGLGKVSELGHAAPATVAMRWRSSATVASNAFAVPTATGSGIDQWSQPRLRVELLVGAVAHRDRQRWATTDLVERGRLRIAEVEAGAAGGGDGARDGPARPGACRH